LSINGIRLGLEVLSVALSGSELEGTLRLTAISNALVQLLEDGLVGILEDGGPELR
jgi:hypothetical protein